MSVRHFVTADNADDAGNIEDATKTCHGSIRAGLVEDVGGLIDPLTHLNLDFPDHQLGECVVVQSFERGSAVLRDEQGLFVTAWPRPEAFSHLGRVDVDGRRLEWLSVMRQRRSEKGVKL
ncbi:MAG: hypothetical protein ACYCU8_07925 [Ferrimicrobium acidiphilum]